MIGLKQKKKSIFEMPIIGSDEPEVRISYAENGFIISCNGREKYVAKSVKEAFDIGKKHFEDMMADESENDED